MNISKAERNQIENEMIFRRLNEKIGDGLDELDKMHLADNNPHLLRDDLVMLLFKCECSDENCEVRIPMRLSRYKEIHVDRQMFIVKPHHQVEPIEMVILEEDDYTIVRKNNVTDEPGDDLNRTNIDNSEH